MNLKRVLARARASGYVFNVGIEPEFFLVVKGSDGSIRGWDPHCVDDLTKPCYDYKGISGALGFLRALNDGLKQLGWGVYQTDHEDANYQYEVNFRYADALATADRLMFFRMMAGQLAQRAGAIATFMAKPFADPHRLGRPHALPSGRREQPAPTCSATSPTRAAWASRSWPIISSAASSSTPRPFAPSRRRRSTATNGSRWARHSPARDRATPGRRHSSLTATTTGRRCCASRKPGHIEDRSISSAFNPYLGIAAYLAAGLDGIDRQLDPGEPNLGNLYTADLETMARRGVRALPQSLRRSAVPLRERRGRPRGPRADRRRIPPTQTRRMARVSRPGRVVGDQTLSDGTFESGFPATRGQGIASILVDVARR